MSTVKKTTRMKLPTGRFELVELFNSYRKANKLRRASMIARYGYKVEKNFVNTIKERIQ